MYRKIKCQIVTPIYGQWPHKAAATGTLGAVCRVLCSESLWLFELIEKADSADAGLSAIVGRFRYSYSPSISSRLRPVILQISSVS